MIRTLGAPPHDALVVQASSPAGAPGVITFEELCAFALAHLPERLRGMRGAAGDVGDLVHDVVIIAYPKLGQFEPRRLGREGEVDVHRSLLAWLVGIARRLVMRQRRRARSRREVCVGDVADLGDGGTGALTPEEMVARGQRWALAVGVLGELRPERAEVLVLHEVGELPVREIAGRLKVNLNTAKSRLNRARRDARAVVQRMARFCSAPCGKSGPGSDQRVRR
jgi:RNA polymerase sigma factor (sigma-70 family)